MMPNSVASGSATSLGDDLDRRGKRVPHAQRAHHQLDRVGQLFLDHRQPLFRLGTDPEEHRADAHDDRDAGPDRQRGLGAHGQADEGHAAERGHDHDQLLRAEGDGGLLRAVGEDGVKRDAARIHVLAHFLAQLFHDLFAVVALFQHFQPAVDPVVEADRAAEGGQVHPLDQHDDADEYQPVDERFDADGHGQSPLFSS